jgi:hypothetical protein
MPKGGHRSRSGRHRTPTELKILTGTFRNTRHKDEPTKKADDGPKFPKPSALLQLTGRQKQLWTLVGKHCGAWTATSDWATVWGLVCLLERLIKTHEAQLETETAGHPLAFRHTVRQVPQRLSARGDTDVEEIEIVEAKSNPLVDQEIKLIDKLRPYIAMLGLSPVDRARMPKMTSKVAVVDPIGALIGRAKR